MPEVPALDRSAAQQRAASNGRPETVANPEPDAPKVVEAHTAILLIMTPEGEVVLTTDINLPVTVTRPASRDEAYGMCAVALKDISSQEIAANSAQQTVQLSIMHNQQAMRQQQDAAIRQQLDRQGGIRPKGMG